MAVAELEYRKGPPSLQCIAAHEKHGGTWLIRGHADHAHDNSRNKAWLRTWSNGSWTGSYNSKSGEGWSHWTTADNAANWAPVSEDDSPVSWAELEGAIIGAASPLAAVAPTTISFAEARTQIDSPTLHKWLVFGDGCSAQGTEVHTQAGKWDMAYVLRSDRAPSALFDKTFQSRRFQLLEAATPTAQAAPVDIPFRIPTVVEVAAHEKSGGMWGMRQGSPVRFKIENNRRFVKAHTEWWNVDGEHRHWLSDEHGYHPLINGNPIAWETLSTIPMAAVVREETMSTDKSDHTEPKRAGFARLQIYPSRPAHHSHVPPRPPSGSRWPGRRGWHHLDRVAAHRAGFWRKGRTAGRDDRRRVSRSRCDGGGKVGHPLCAQATRQDGRGRAAAAVRRFRRGQGPATTSRGARERTRRGGVCDGDGR